MRRRCGLLLLLLGVTTAQVALADGVPPVTLQLREHEAGRFVAQWRVPQQIPPRAIPSPVMPETCRAIGERTLTERPGAWFLRQSYDCPEGIAGQLVGIDFPMLNGVISTILRVELLSGDRYAHSFAPQEGPWRVPDATAGDARAVYQEAQEAVLSGIDHAARHGLHWAFVLALLLVGGAAGGARLGGAFAGAQVLGLLLSRVTGLVAPAALAAVGLAAAVALLAREALRTEGERRQLAALAACGGLVHGLGLSALIALPANPASSPVVHYLLAIVGMDGLLLAAAAAVALFSRLATAPLPAAARTTVAYVAGVAAVALALGMPATNVAAEGTEASGLQLPDLPIPEGSSAAPASRRLATGLPEAAIQSFVTVAPFEVRHEILVNLVDLAPELGVEPGGTVELDELDGVRERLVSFLAARHELEIDGAAVEPAMRRVDFMTVDDRGVLPRQDPVVEQVDSAWIGMTAAYLTPQTPETLEVTWPDAAGQEVLPATITDPETTRSDELTARQPTLLWTNELSEDPTPVVSAIAVEPPVGWLPLASILALALGAVVGLGARRRGALGTGAAFARAALLGACLLAPVGAVAVPLPGALGAAPDTRDAQRILARLLPNIYRAFEFPTESAVYDRLALVATGDTLGEIYLEHRRAVELEERGGARARVEAVEVLGVEAVEPGNAEGFVADAVWTVGGTVTHFGHRHFRQNRYDAQVAVVPEEGTWKIRTIEVFDEERLQ